MLKFQIVTKNDLKEAAILERRKRYETERKARIFNAKQRLFGQDYEALQQQISEKKKKDQIQGEHELLLIQENNRRALIIHEKEKEIAEKKQKYQADIDMFRCQYQRKEDRREFDLNDPEFHKKSQPARRSDFDERLGISSAQIFIGEDLNGSSRKIAQREQQRAWLDQQIKERKQDESDRAKADLLLHQAMKARDQETLLYASYERNNKSKMQNSILDFNKKLAAEKKAKQKKDKQHEEEDNLAEIYNMMSSDMLTENPECANSHLGLNKKIAILYRGMTPAELEVFRRDQHIQIQNNQTRRTEEQLMEKVWDQQDINLTRTIMLKNLEVSRNTKSQIAEIKNENKLLAQEQKARNDANAKSNYTNAATDEFFEQFNRTSR